jgi:sugar phosphate isomerase/epimerase
MNQVGTDLKFENGRSAWGDIGQTLAHVAGQGLDGVAIRTLDELSPTLDTAFLRDVAQTADDLGLYVEMGVGKVNPYMTAELPRVRALGDGSYVRGMERMIELCAEFGWTELWTATGGFKLYPGIHFTDRFRTDADWADQLATTQVLLRRLAPVLRATGCHLNLETHEEITTFELVRLVEAVGDDVLGICLDPGNVVVRGELPYDAVERVAPYVRSTQLRDATLWTTDTGLSRLLAPCGEGVVDWHHLLKTVLAANPALRLTIEGIGEERAEMPLHLTDPAWRAGHRDLTDEDVATLRRLAAQCEQRAARGETESLDDLRRLRDDVPAHDEFVSRSAAHLRALLTP